MLISSFYSWLESLIFYFLIFYTSYKALFFIFKYVNFATYIYEIFLKTIQNFVFKILQNDEISSIFCKIAKWATGTTFIQLKQGKYVTFKYLNNDEEKILYLKYNRRYKYNILYSYKDGNKYIINHPQGVPFLVTANDLNVDYIEVINKFNESKKFKGDDKVELYFKTT